MSGAQTQTPLQVMYTMKCMHSVYAGTYATNKYVFYVIILGVHIDTHGEAILCALCIFTKHILKKISYLYL